MSLFKIREAGLLSMEYSIIADAMRGTTLSKFTAAVSDARCIGALPIANYVAKQEDMN